MGFGGRGVVIVVLFVLGASSATAAATNISTSCMASKGVNGMMEEESVCGGAEQHGATSQQPPSSTALVVFRHTNPFANPFQQEKRFFTIGREERDEQYSITIKQRWENRTQGLFQTFVWDAAFVLSEWLGRNPDLVSGKQCVELGCGAGLLSIAAAKLGASRVYATDADDDSLALTRENADINACEDGVLSTHKLWWGTPLPAPMDAESNRMDVVLGTDLFYRPEFFEPLISSILSMIQPESSLLVIAHKRRGLGEDDFLRLLGERGFSHEEVPKEEMHADFRHMPIRITMHRLVRKNVVK